MSKGKKILVAVAVTLILAAGGLYGYYQALVHGWVRYNEYDIRTEGQLQVGDLAPDLALAGLEGEERVPLSDFYRVKPLVLVFGSYT